MLRTASSFPPTPLALENVVVSASRNAVAADHVLVDRQREVGVARDVLQQHLQGDRKKLMVPSCRACRSGQG